MKHKLLIVEDQFIEANNLKLILQSEGYEVCGIAASVNTALNIIDKERPGLVLIDIMLDGVLTGIDLAHRLREKRIAFVFLSANADKQILEAAKRTEPYGFLVKPFRKKDVLVMLDIAWYLHENRSEPGTKKQNNHSTPKTSAISADAIIGKSKATQDVLESIRVVGNSDISVLVLGESGTGKELVAQSIHESSARRRQSFIVVNCAALPMNLVESELFGHEKGSFTGATDKRIGKFAQAEGGTIFLDEIGELPVDLQAKLLRVLQSHEIEPIGGQTKKINVRVIAATNRDLEEEIANGRFRLDLYYRLNVFPVQLPPLRERKEDIVLLAEHFVKQYSEKEKKVIDEISDEVKKALLNYSWPGNIRQLENIMIRAVLLTNENCIRQVNLPSTPIRKGSDNSNFKSIEENERDYIVAALEKCGGKLYGHGGAAELLNINGSTLSSRIKKLGINKKKEYR